MGKVLKELEKLVIQVVAVLIITIAIMFPIIGLTMLLLSVISPEFNSFMSDQFGIIFGIFGIGPEDIVAAYVSDQLLFGDEEQTASMLTSVAIMHQKTDTGILTLLTQKTNSARGSYTNYFNNGDTEYSHGLPDTNLHSQKIPTDALRNSIDEDFGVTSTIVTATIGVPSKEEHVYSTFYKLYGYIESTNTMNYNGLVYSLTDISYNYETNNYDIIISRQTTKTVETTVLVTSANDTNDQVSTTVHTSHLTAEGVVEDGSTTVLTNVPIGTVVDSYTTIDTVDNGYMSITTSLVAPPPYQHYVVSFYTTNDSHIHYWIYHIGAGDDTALNEANTFITQLDMLPVVMIRNNSVSINSNKESDGYKETQSILSTIGLDADTLLETIESNPEASSITSSYIHFAVDPKESNPTTARILFETFDYIHKDTSLFDPSTSSYIATISEGAYNASLMWKRFDKTITPGIIGSVDYSDNRIEAVQVFHPAVGEPEDIDYKEEYTESIDTLFIRKQTAPEYYTEYAIDYLASTTFISNGAFHETATGTLGYGSLLIPISKHFVDMLTPLEQMEVFTKTLRISIYALSVQHLHYYETEAFFGALKIIMYIVALVIFIFTWYDGGMTAGAFITAVTYLIVAMAVSYAFKLLLESTDNPWLKTLYTIIYIVVSIYLGTFDASAFYTIDVILFTIATFADTVGDIYLTKQEQLAFAREQTREIADAADELLQEAVDTSLDYLTTLEVATFATIDSVQPFLNSVDVLMYKARDIQFDAVRITVTDFYTHSFDYDRYYYSGVV